MSRRDGFDPFALPPLRASERRRLLRLGLALAAGYGLVVAAWVVYAVAG
jgi:hypothetical protein